MYERGIINILIIVIGLLIAFVLIGLFSTSGTVKEETPTENINYIYQQ